MKTKIPNIPTLGNNITVIVITGGPCSGKTTALTEIVPKLSDQGYKVLVSPESATKLMNAGMILGELPREEFQKEILLDALHQEERVFSIARQYRDRGHKVVVLCDRGAMDGEAYVGSKEFRSIVEQIGYTYRELCDSRYHAVIHLRTAALGAEEFYTTANNTARKETLEQARKLDNETFLAWTRHQHHVVVDNSTDFNGKVQRLSAEICSILEDRKPIEKG